MNNNFTIHGRSDSQPLIPPQNDQAEKLNGRLFSSPINPPLKESSSKANSSSVEVLKGKGITDLNDPGEDRELQSTKFISLSIQSSPNIPSTEAETEESEEFPDEEFELQSKIQTISVVAKTQETQYETTKRVVTLDSGFAKTILLEDNSNKLKNESNVLEKENSIKLSNNLEQKKAVLEQKKAVLEEKKAVLEEKKAVLEEKKAVLEEKKVVLINKISSNEFKNQTVLECQLFATKILDEKKVIMRDETKFKKAAETVVTNHIDKKIEKLGQEQFKGFDEQEANEIGKDIINETVKAKVLGEIGPNGEIIDLSDEKREQLREAFSEFFKDYFKSQGLLLPGPVVQSLQTTEQKSTFKAEVIELNPSATFSPTASAKVSRATNDRDRVDQVAVRISYKREQLNIINKEILERKKELEKEDEKIELKHKIVKMEILSTEIKLKISKLDGLSHEILEKAILSAVAAAA